MLNFKILADTQAGLEVWVWVILIAVALIVGIVATSLVLFFMPSMKAKRATINADKIINSTMK